VASSDQSKVTIPRPTSIRSTRPGLRALAFGLVLLGLCVFAWGLRYKLSLYDPPHAVSHHMPAAKLLLPGKEHEAVPLAATSRPGVNPIAPDALSLLAFVLFTAAAARLRPGFGASIFRFSPVRRVPACARSAPAFVRPPPSTR
jgi:hypothetical protein